MFCIANKYFYKYVWQKAHGWCHVAERNNLTGKAETVSTLEGQIFCQMCRTSVRICRNVRTSFQYYYDAWALNVINYCLCSTLMVCHFSREKHSFGNVWKHFSFWNIQSTQLVFILTKTNNSSSELSHFKLVYRDKKTSPFKV